MQRRAMRNVARRNHGKGLDMIHAFLLGIWEFRSSLTTSFEDYNLLLAYDRGRELAHRLTFRVWDEV